MKKIRATALLCTLLFAVGVFAFQYPSAQPNSGQMGTSPSQQTTQPPQTTPPSQTPSTPSPQGQQPGQGQMPNIDNQVKMLADQLTLTSDQQSKVRVILVDQHEQAMGLVKDNGLSREDKLAKIHSLREGTIAKVRQILTAEQKPKFDQMIQQQDERIRQEQGGSNTPPGTSSPSSTAPGSTAPSTTPPASNPPGKTPPPSNPPSGIKPPQ
jgi:periplasmic protein CpxP/Spy